MRRFIRAAALIAMLGVQVQAAQINEIRIDQPGDDEDEYFELWGAPGELLDGLSYVVLGDGSAGSGEIELALDLSGNAIPTDGYLLVAEDGNTFGATADLTATLDFENSDNVTHLLVTGFTGAQTDDLDANDDGVLDSLPWTSIVDGLALVEDLAAVPAGTEFHYAGQLGLPIVGPDGSSVPAHVYRSPDGGPLQVGTFETVGGVDTPGGANIPEPASILLFVLAGAAAAMALRKRR